MLVPQALAVGGSTVSVTSATASFDPTMGQIATINYRVIGPDAASELRVRIFIRAAAALQGRLCNTSADYLVSTIYGPANRSVGNYTATWNGKYANGANYAPGFYCYSISWSNPPVGAVNVPVEGHITINNPGNPATGAGYNYGDGGAAGGNNNNNGGVINPSAGAVSAYADPVVINPNAADGNYTTIHYTVNRDLPQGFDLSMYDNAGIKVTTLNMTTGLVRAGSIGSPQWNGRRSNWQVVLPGDYFFKFKDRVTNTVVSSGLVRVTYDTVAGGGQNGGNQGGGNQVQPGSVTANVYPGVIDPTKGESSNISYTVNGGGLPNGMSLTIRDNQNIIIRTFFRTTGNIPGGTTGFYSWNGKYDDGRNVPGNAQGMPYKYVFAVGDQILTSGWIYVKYEQNVNQGTFVQSHSANPSTFYPANSEKTVISYTLGKNVRNFRVTVSDQNYSMSRILRTSDSLSTGSYSTEWDGTFNGSIASNGQYRYTLSADNESSVSGNLIVATRINPDPVGRPVITDLGASPSRFDPYSNNSADNDTTIGYRLTQDSRVDVTVMRGDLTIRRLLISGFSNNGLASGINYVPWDGRSDNGSVVSYDTYRYVIEARNNNGVATLVEGSVTVADLATHDCSYYNNCGTFVQSHSANPSTFYPANSEKTVISYTLGKNVRNFRVTVSDQNYSMSRILRTSDSLSTGSYSTEWDGTFNSSVAANGQYRYTLSADNESSVSGNLIVASNNNNYGLMNVSDVYADPVTFDPESTNTYLNFTLNQSSYVTVTVRLRSDDSFVKTVLTNQYYNSGARSVGWNGTNSYGSVVDNGSYNFRVDVSNADYGSDTETASVTVERNGNNSGTLNISADGFSPNPFNPRNQSARITFSTNRYVTSTRVRIYNYNSDYLVRELSVYNTGSNSYRADWDGRNSATNDMVAEGNYTYKINVTDASGNTVERTGTVYVRYYDSGSPYYNGNCGGFTDISRNNKLCPALEFVRTRGIFNGYPDNGKIEMNRVIKRAEFLQVIQKAFGFQMDPYNPYYDNDLGYRDLRDQTNEWYMPLVKTFSRLKLMVGYPDNTMKPERTMNMAELFLVFFKAAKKAPDGTTHYTVNSLVSEQPYLDTPINDDTMWYIRYAAFSKLHDLVTGNYFHPSKGITRGQVIKLIYETSSKDLIDYVPPILTSNSDYNYYTNRNY